MISSSAATNGDYLYSLDAALEGYWNGIWGVMRNYTAQRADLFPLPNNTQPVAMRNTVNFDGICPKTFVRAGFNDFFIHSYFALF